MPLSLTPSRSTPGPSQSIDLTAINQAIATLAANETIDDATVADLKAFVKAIDLTPYAKAADVKSANLTISSLFSDTGDAIDVVGQRVSAEELSRKAADKAQATGLDEEAIAQSFISAWLGYSCHEKSHRQEGSDWMLQSLTFLNPQRWVFRGTIGSIVDLHYFGNFGDLYIPYEKVLHCINAPHFTLDNSPYGFSELKSAIAPYRAWKIIVAQMTVSAGRQANGLLVGYVDPDGSTQEVLDEKGVPVVGNDGAPLMADPAEDMGRELAGIDGRSYIITSTKNKIENLKIEPSIDFYLGVLKYLHKLMYLSLLFPETMLELVGGGSGDSNLHAGQASLLGQWVDQLADQIKEQILERVVRELIVWKFGEQDNWGSFPVPEQAEGQRVELFNALVSALTQQVFSVDDLDVINKLRTLAGLPELDKIIAPPAVESTDPSATDTGAGQFSIPVGVDYWKIFERNGHGALV